MQKTYLSKTEISINVSVAGRHRHISFTPMTLGGSFLTTDDADVQQAVEAHPKFGRQITVQEEVVFVPLTETEEAEQDETLRFACYADAKEYLAQRFGISRTRLRQTAQIHELAEKHHITLIIE